MVKHDDKEREIAERREELEDVKNWELHSKEFYRNKQDLEHELEEAREKHRGELENIKKERGIAIDKLRKEMLFNIRNVKVQMHSMNEDQLQGTTKLTVKQNI